MALADMNAASSQFPIRTLIIMLDKGHRPELFTQLQKFATIFAFDYNYADFGTGSENFLLEMLRADVTIDINNVPPDPTNITVRFYDKDSAHPAAKQTVDELFNYVESLIGQVPGATFSVQK